MDGTTGDHSMKFANQIVIFVLLAMGPFAQQNRQQNATASEADISPEMFGATGDGDGDDTSALKQAIATGKRVVAMPGKTYKMTSAITVSTANQTLDFRNARLK